MVVDGHRLEYLWHGPAPSAAPTLVFLHQGLGSAAMWKAFPSALAARTGCGALVYSRRGHGGSDPWDGPRSSRFMHDEALTVLPRVLEALEVEWPILVGHSDGASIALIYAGAHVAPVRGLLLEAPHVFVEDLSVTSIAAARVAFDNGDLRARLERYHGPNTQAMFRGWNDVWLSPEFRAWTIEDYLPGVEVPMLVIQGLQDEYGTVAQVEAIRGQASGPVSVLLLDDCRHAPHRDKSREVLEAMATFVKNLLGGVGTPTAPSDGS